MRVAKVKTKIHVVLDQKDCDILRQGGQRRQDVLALLLRHASRGLIEQQHARPGCERQRDFEQALFAVREFARRLVHLALEAKARQEVLDLRDDRRPRASDPPEVGARAVALGDREAKRSRPWRQVGKELIDLERAREPKPHPPARRQRRDVAVFKQNLPLARLDDSRQEIDERRLAGAVRPDQRVTRASLQNEGHFVRGEQRAEPLDEPSRLQRLARITPRPRERVLGAKDEAARTAKS